MRLLSILVLFVSLVAPFSAPAFAGQAENALLEKYVGAWSGTGQLTGAQKGRVACKLTLKMSDADKLNYSGRCTFGAGVQSFRGTMLYNDAKKRFEASTSSTGVSGTAIGKKSGGGIVFNMSGMETRAGTASSTMALAGNSIKIEFKLVDKKGKTTGSGITFKKS